MEMLFFLSFVGLGCSAKRRKLESENRRFWWCFGTIFGVFWGHVEVLERILNQLANFDDFLKNERFLEPDWSPC